MATPKIHFEIMILNFLEKGPNGLEGTMCKGTYAFSPFWHQCMVAQAVEMSRAGFFILGMKNRFSWCG